MSEGRETASKCFCIRELAWQTASGFTLLELLVSVILTGALILAITGHSVAFLRTARDVEVTGRLQQELVFATEAIVNQLKMATRWEKTSDAPLTYAVYGIDLETFNELDTPVNISLDGTQLRVGTRLVSANISAITISEGYPAEIAVVDLSTVPVKTGLSSAPPLTMDVEVFMRNRPVVYGYDDSDPPIRIASGPEPTQVTRNSVTLEWSTSPLKTYGDLFFRRQDSAPEDPWTKVTFATKNKAAMSHDPKLTGLTRETAYYYYLVIFDEQERRFDSRTYTFQTLP